MAAAAAIAVTVEDAATIGYSVGEVVSYAYATVSAYVSPVSSAAYVATRTVISSTEIGASAIRTGSTIGGVVGEVTGGGIGAAVRGAGNRRAVYFSGAFGRSIGQRIGGAVVPATVLAGAKKVWSTIKEHSGPIGKRLTDAYEDMYEHYQKWHTGDPPLLYPDFVEHLEMWRHVHHARERPAAPQYSAWELAAARLEILGDFEALRTLADLYARDRQSFFRFCDRVARRFFTFVRYGGLCRVLAFRLSPRARRVYDVYASCR